MAGSIRAAFTRFAEAVRADHRALDDFGRRYNADRSLGGGTGGSLLSDAVTRIGFQLLLAVRVMHLLRDVRVPFGAQFASRLIRHLYGAEIHWDAEIAPGVVVAHGNGLVVSRSAVVGPGCLLFQGVTLGESVGGTDRVLGAPRLERDVHVMPNAVLVGPIVVGAGSKIAANVSLSESVAAGSRVHALAPVVTERARFVRTDGVEAAPADEDAP